VLLMLSLVLPSVAIPLEALALEGAAGGNADGSQYGGGDSDGGDTGEADSDGDGTSDSAEVKPARRRLFQWRQLLRSQEWMWVSRLSTPPRMPTRSPVW
jgi:hypothetical protein